MPNFQKISNILRCSIFSIISTSKYLRRIWDISAGKCLNIPPHFCRVRAMPLKFVLYTSYNYDRAMTWFRSANQWYSINWLGGFNLKASGAWGRSSRWGGVMGRSPSHTFFFILYKKKIENNFSKRKNVRNFFSVFLESSETLADLNEIGAKLNFPS